MNKIKSKYKNILSMNTHKKIAVQVLKIVVIVVFFKIIISSFKN